MSTTQWHLLSLHGSFRNWHILIMFSQTMNDLKIENALKMKNAQIIVLPWEHISFDRKQN